MDNNLIVMVISSAFAIMGAYIWNKYNYLQMHGQKTTGVVFKNNKKAWGDKFYYPVVRFTTLENQEWITQELNIGYPKPLSEGSNIKIIYDPEDPHEVVQDTFFLMVLMPRLLVACGITALIIASLSYLNIINLSNF